MNKNKLEISTTFDFDGCPDFYSGHGHAFAPKNLIACIRFGFPISYNETVGEIIQHVIEDINQTFSIEIVNEKLYKKYEDTIRNLEDKDFEESIRAELKNGVQDNDSFFDIPNNVKEEPEMDIFEPSPYLIGYIHIFEK